MKFIESKDNCTIKKFRSLSVKKYREQFSLFKIEGEKVCAELAEKPELIENVIVESGFEETYASIIEKYNDKAILCTPEVFDSLSSTVEHQHIMMICKFKKYSLSDLTSNKILVLDHLQDPGNLGTIIRSSVASGFEDIVLIDSVEPFNEKTTRSTSGTIFYPKFYEVSTNEFTKFTQDNGYDIIIAEASGKSIFDEDIKFPQKYALVIGNEGNGVSDQVIDHKTFSVSIPMNSRVESLNAGVSASVLMFILANKK